MTLNKSQRKKKKTSFNYCEASAGNGQPNIKKIIIKLL